MESIFHIADRRKLSSREHLTENEWLLARRYEQIKLAASFPLPPLPQIPDAKLLRPNDAEYTDYLPLHNKRNDVAPALRIVCQSAQAVSESVKWISAHNLPVALRSGGHCFEGYSQTPGVVIDVRGLNTIVIDAAQNTVSVGAGVDLGSVYRKVSAEGYAFAAGSCPTVGIAGHTLGGGVGLLSRRYGLACDNLQGIELVDASGLIRTANSASEADLFWAAKGGGGGSFGVATELLFQIHPLTHVHTFVVTWDLANTFTDILNAMKVFDAWQHWAPNAPDSIMAIMKVQKLKGGRLRLRCIGQTTGTEEDVRSELETKLIVEKPTGAVTIRRRTFIKAVEYFAGGNFDYQPVFMEGKSDVIEQLLSTDAMRTMFDAILRLPVGSIVAICDPYGGAIANIPHDASAFPHRGAGTWGIQYYSQWEKASQSARRLAEIQELYDCMRPHVSGNAYVNYPDLNLADFAASYWRSNFSRLRQIKKNVDPGNIFQHGQSIPLI